MFSQITSMLNTVLKYKYFLNNAKIENFFVNNKLFLTIKTLSGDHKNM